MYSHYKERALNVHCLSYVISVLLLSFASGCAVRLLGVAEGLDSQTIQSSLQLAPNLSISAPSVSTVGPTGVATFDVVYSNVTSVNLTAADVVLNAAFGVSCDKSVVNGSTTTPKVILSNCSGNGAIGITIQAGTASNGSSDLAPASAASQTLTSDPTLPGVVYYSVGQNTSDHKSGDPTLTISQGIGTFSVSQTASNLGVGDRVSYGAASVAYIAAKISTSHWALVTATGAIPANIVDATVSSIAHAYSSLSAAIAGASDASHLNNNNLNSAGVSLYFPCYYDSGPDTSAVFLTGYTTDSSHSIRIYTPSNISTEVNQSQRHLGKWDADKYSLEPTAVAHALRVAVDYARIDGLQIASKQDGIYLDDWINAEPNEIFISNNIVKYVGVVGGFFHGIEDYTCGSHDLKIWNNIVYGFGGYGIGGYNLTTAYVYNNTIFNCSIGIQAKEGPIVAINNLIQNCTTGFSTVSTGTFSALSNYNISNDNTAPGANSKNSATVSFVDSGQFDFHLLASDTVAKDAGLDLSTDPSLPFSIDIDGQSRSSGSWDVGADESL